MSSTIVALSFDAGTDIGVFAAKFVLSLVLLTILIPCSICLCAVCCKCISSKKNKQLEDPTYGKKAKFTFEAYSDRFADDIRSITKLCSKNKAVLPKNQDSKMSDTPQSLTHSDNADSTNTNLLEENNHLQVVVDNQSKKRLFVYHFDTYSKSNYDFFSKSNSTDNQFTLIEHFVNVAIRTLDPVCDEIALIISSPGGSALDYGRAYEYLMRLNTKGFRMVALIDDVAASGGYLLACACNKIYCTEKSIIGSIGVIAEIPNFHKLMDKAGIEWQRFVSRERKGGFPMFTPYSQHHIDDENEHIQEVFTVFKDAVIRARPSANIEDITTGSHWMGRKALDKGLVDGISTSDDYLRTESDTKDVFLVSLYSKKKGFLTKLRNALDPLGSLQTIGMNLISSILKRMERSKYEYIC